MALVESGGIGVEPSGEFRADGRSSRHPVEAAVLDAVGTRGYRSVESIRWRLAQDERLAQEFRHLVTDRMLRHSLIPSRLVRTSHPHATAAGRRALQEFAEHASATTAGAVQVALHGRDAMTDQRLRDQIFEARPTVLPPRSARRPSRTVDPSHLSGAPYQKSGTSESATDHTFFDRSLGGGSI